MSNRRTYEHEVDIRSTQIENGLKGCWEAYMGCGCLFGILFIGFWVVAIGGVFVQDIFDQRRGVKNLSFYEYHRDYASNIVKAKKIWQNRYVSVSGKITEISEGRVEIEDIDGEVGCRLKWFKGDILAELNKGQKVWVIGKISASGTRYDSSRDYVILRHCEIKEAY